MSSLVERLTNGEHPVSLVRYKTTEEFEEAVERGFVLVKFTGTRGGTELGFRIDPEHSRTDRSQSEKIRLVGPLTLDYQEVTCTVEIDPETLEGSGGLVLRNPPAAESGKSADSATPTEPARRARKSQAQKKKARSKTPKKAKAKAKVKPGAK